MWRHDETRTHPAQHTLGAHGTNPPHRVVSVTSGPSAPLRSHSVAKVAPDSTLAGAGLGWIVHGVAFAFPSVASRRVAPRRAAPRGVVVVCEVLRAWQGWAIWGMGHGAWSMRYGVAFSHGCMCWFWCQC